MFDVSALLSLKPAAPAIDPGQPAGTDAVQTNPFSQILSTQIETLPSGPIPADGALPELAALHAALDPAGNRQTTGKILPDAVPLAAATPPEEAAPEQGAPPEPVGKLLASRLGALAAKGAAEGRLVQSHPDAGASADAPTDAEPGQAAAGSEDEPVTVASIRPVAAQVANLIALPVSAPDHPAKAAPAAAQPPATPAQQTPAQTPVIQVATTVAGVTPPQPAAIDLPATVSAIALVAAQGAGPDVMLPIAPPAQATVFVAHPGQATDGLAGSIPQQAAAPAPDPAIASVEPVIEPEVVQQAAVAHAKPAGATKIGIPRDAAAARAERTPVPAAASTGSPLPGAEAQPADRSAAATAVAPQPATLLNELRQPVVGPATASVTAMTPLEAPRDFAALVDRLVAARETAAPQPVQAAIAHAEFGRISLDFRQDGGELSVAMKSADAGFAPAVMAALDRSAAGEAQQPSLQAQAAAQFQTQAQAQSQSQHQAPSQSQSQNQPSGSSAQPHQDGSGPRGDANQGRSGQERGARYQPNSSPSARDGNSSQPRNGTYA